VLVLLLVKWQKYGSMSLRSCRHCLQELVLVLGLNLRVPSHWWVCKCGYYRVVEKAVVAGEDYVVIIDESIVLGGEKLLLILGVKEETMHFEAGLDFSAMEVLFVGGNSSWKSGQVGAKLQEIAQKYTLSFYLRVSEAKSALQTFFQ
jgi:hypothetical protein